MNRQLCACTRADSLEEHGSIVPFLDLGNGGAAAAVSLADGVDRKLAAMAAGLLGLHGLRPCRRSVLRSRVAAWRI